MLGLIVALALATAPAALTGHEEQKTSAPETFSANAQVQGEAGAAAVMVTVRIDRYTSEKDRDVMGGALKSGGYSAFLQALRKAPQVGTVEIGTQKWPIRWAREQMVDKRRSIVTVTDQPIYFVGGGRVDAKSKEGYELAILQLDVDDIGLGTGSMAAAARVKPGGPTGVQVDDYATQPVKFLSVRKLFK